VCAPPPLLVTVFPSALASLKEGASSGVGTHPQMPRLASQSPASARKHSRHLLARGVPSLTFHGQKG